MYALPHPSFLMVTSALGGISNQGKGEAGLHYIFADYFTGATTSLIEKGKNCH